MAKFLLSLILAFLPLSSVEAVDTELNCLAKNVYYESRGESKRGKLAVALVTLNRVEDTRYPDTICDVVYQKHQFSWTKAKTHAKVNQEQWRQSFEAALEAYMNRDVLGNFKATHFHATHVNPRWNLKRVAKIDNHVFYK